MSTTLATPKPETTVFPAIAATAMVEIPLDQIEPSPFNRKQFSQKALEELAGSIVQTNGVLQPVVLRPFQGKGAVLYQIVAGERRWLASKIARDKLKFNRNTISATVKELTDAQAIEVTLAENAQREDVHALELCRTYKALMGQTDSASGKPYTRELIAERVKKSYSVVCDILNADKAIPEVQQAAREGKINSSLVLEISKYQPLQQEEIFSECFGMTLKEIARDKDAIASMSVRDLRSWIADNVHIDLSKAPFSTKDELLLKGAPSCVKCPKRTGSDPGLFAEAQEVKKGDTCTDPGCYDAKKTAFVELRIAEEQRQAAPTVPVEQPKQAPLPPNVKPAGPSMSQSSALQAARAGLAPAASAPPLPAIEVQKISILQTYQLARQGRAEATLYTDEYNLAKPGCTKEKKAIYVDGPQIGKTVFICAVKSCSNHGYSSNYSTPRDPITHERKLEIWNQKVQFVYRDEMLKLITAKLPGKIGDQEAALLGEYILRTLPHRDHEKVARIFGLKDSDADSLQLHMRKLKPEALMKFLVVCSLVEALGVDQLAFDVLDKESPLKIAAKAYKVDDQKLLEAAKAQLESKRPKSEEEKKAAEKPASKPLDAPKKAAKGKKVDHVKEAQKRAAKAKQKTKKK